MGSRRAVTSTASGTAARQAAKQASGTTATKARARPESAEPGTDAPVPTVVRRRLDPDVLVAMEEERDFLLASLADLEREHDAGDVDDVDYETLKDDYTARAATVIRALEEREALASEVRTGRRRSPARIAAWVAGVLALAIVAGVLMAQASGRRSAGDSVSGDIRQSSRDKLMVAQSQFGDGQVLDAIKTYDEVLAEQPNNAEALTYKAWLLYRASAASGGGQVSDADIKTLQDRALSGLDQAVKADPSYADAHIFRAIIYRDLGRLPEAAKELDLVPASRVPAMMQSTVDGLRTQVNGGSTTTSAASSSTP